jgi:CubicO group peptidase (beta-lactamase class C family)
MGESVFKKVPVRDCLVVIKDGALVYEKYSKKKWNTTAHVGFSQTKTLGALLAGWAHTQGKLDIDADITTAYVRVFVFRLFFVCFSLIPMDVAQGVKSPRPYPVTARQIMSQALDGDKGPGQAWAYDAVGTRWINHLPQLYPNATGLKPSAVFEEHFRGPLGLSKGFEWKTVDSAWDAGSYGTCRDYARFGQLMLNRGMWAADALKKTSNATTQIVAGEYIDMMVTPQTMYPPYGPNYSNPCYGLLTWLNINPGSDRGSSKYPGVCKDWPKRTWFPKGSGSNVYLLAGLLGQVIQAHCSRP